MRGFALGVVTVLLAVAIVGAAGIWFGFISVSADKRPSGAEEALANASLYTATERRAQNLKAPFSPTDDTLLVGMRLYVRHCSVCHGLADGQASRMAQGFYIKAPQLATDGFEQYSEGMLYWWGEHGIRFSPMPAFKNTIPSEAVWKIAMFMKRADRLPPTIDAAWKASSRLEAR